MLSGSHLHGWPPLQRAQPPSPPCRPAVSATLALHLGAPCVPAEFCEKSGMGTTTELRRVYLFVLASQRVLHQLKAQTRQYFQFLLVGK